MIRWAVGRPAVIWAISVAIILAGMVSFTRLPLATKTTVELPRLRIAAGWPGTAAELVEMYLTAPIEAATQAVRGVRKTSSESREGFASLEVELEPDIDVQLARLGILERLELLRPEFPPGATPATVTNFVPEELDEVPLLEYTLSGPYTPGALERIARDRILPRVSAIPGVAVGEPSGGADLGVSVSYDPTQLRQLGIAPAEIARIIAESRMVRSLGQDQAGATERRVVLRDQPDAIEDLGALPVRGAGGLVYRLSEVTSIRQEEDAGGSFYRINGRPAVSMRISRLPGADAIKTAAAVRTLLDELKPGLPEGLRLSVATDESVDLAKQLRDLSRRGAIAFVLVGLVLSIALRNAKSVLLVLGSAAVAITGTALGLYLLDVPANLLTLAGLGMGVGILVQNGLVVVERLRRAPDTKEGRAEVGIRILPALLGATMTTAVVLFPFLYLQGNARAAFVPFATAFALALGCSVLSAVFMIPALSAGHGASKAHWPWVSRFYQHVVIRLLRWRWVTLGLAVAALGVVTWGFIEKVPRTSWGDWFGQRTTLSVFLSFPRGSDPASLDRGMRDFESIVVGVPGVEQVVTAGGGRRGRFGGGANMQVLFEKEAGLTALPRHLEEELTQRAVFIGGARVAVRGQGPGFSSGFGGGGSVSFRIKILGYSFAGVERLAYDLKARLERIRRVRDVDVNAGSFWFREKAFTVTLEPDRDALARHSVSGAELAAAVAREVRGAAGGQRIEIDGEELPVTLKTAGSLERTLDELRSAVVPNPANSPVRVGDLASVGEQETLSNISREDQQYVRIVSYDFRGPSKLARRTHDAFMAVIAVPAGYQVDDEVFAWEDDESGKGLWLVFGVGIVLVILVVAMVFDSVWAAGLVFMSLPLALGGVGAAFWMTEAAFTREAAVGVILVVGLAVNQAILLIDAALEKRRRRLSRTGRAGLSKREVVSACRDRGGMIVLVTLTTLASLLPLAIGTDSDSLFGAIALATTGGVAAGTVAALIVLPVLIPGVRRVEHRSPS
ncbi:MAG: efflux RND transporter permease subunit [Gemmatimonadales bacterium]|nr:efflux RND transporter permease subunit [Gemmatimonadales bacterium]